MARVYLVPTDPQYALLYLVDSPVGPNQINKRDDVFLVQFFLKVISEHDRLYIPQGQSPIQIDGIHGPQTAAYIRQYQLENSRRNGPKEGGALKQDGIVHPIQAGSTFFSPISKRLYTIIALNISYGNVRGKEMLRDITKDPLFPGGLRPSIAVG